MSFTGWFFDAFWRGAEWGVSALGFLFVIFAGCVLALFAAGLFGLLDPRGGGK